MCVGRLPWSHADALSVANVHAAVHAVSAAAVQCTPLPYVLINRALSSKVVAALLTAAWMCVCVQRVCLIGLLHFPMSVQCAL